MKKPEFILSQELLIEKEVTKTIEAIESKLRESGYACLQFRFECSPTLLAELETRVGSHFKEREWTIDIAVSRAHKTIDVEVY